MLSEQEQERHARHLILDGWGGLGLERLAAATVELRGDAASVRWAARYLAASGVGRLLVGDPGAAALEECRALAPGLLIEQAPAKREIVPGPLLVDLRAAASPAAAALAGAEAALAAVRTLLAACP